MRKTPSAIARVAAVPCVVLLMSSVMVYSQSPKNFAQARREFKTFYEQGMRKNGIVGSSFMLIQDGQVIAQEFFGLANQEKQQPVDENTIYHWASITKTFTGIAIMQLRDRGRLKLDDPILKYLPELKAVHNPFGSMNDITLKHLMTHSAGFRGATWPWGGDKDWQPHEPREWAQLAAMMPYTEIQFKPGSKFSYSNLGIIFLGRVIEQLSGDDYEVYIDKNIFKPLEMYRSYFDATPYHLLKHRAASYWLKEGKTTPARFDVDTGITVSNGGLNAPLGDMAKWLTFLIEGSDAILRRSSLEEMAVPQIRARDGEGGSGDDVQAGLSCFIERHGGVTLIGHSGDQNGFISHLYVHRPTRSGYIVSFNTDAASKKDPARTTRAADDAVREVIMELLK